MSIEYVNIAAYRVTQRLRGELVHFKDEMAEHLPCAGCGAPVGYFCLSLSEAVHPFGAMDPLGYVFVSRFTCKGIIGSQNPRTLLAFAKGAEEILVREAKK